MAKKLIEVELEEKPEKIKFTKQQLLKSKKYIHQADLLNALLDDGFYTLDEVEVKMNKYMKG